MSRRTFLVARSSRCLMCLAVVAMCIGAFTACSSNPSSTEATSRSQHAATSNNDPAANTSTLQTNPPPPTTTAPPAQSASVETVTLDLTDTSRPTVRLGETVATTRHLPTTVYLPADASGRVTGSSLPWLIFLHGFDSSPEAYDGMLRTWARAGYAVAAPILPLTSSQGSDGLDEGDMVNEPADVSFLIDSLLTRSAESHTPLTGRLDGKRIGVAGHSDGANVAFTSGYSQRFGDRRITAVIDLSGELPTGLGPFPQTGDVPPLLMIASDADEYVPVAHSRELYDAIGGKRWWVELHGVSHAPPFTEENAWSKVVDQVSVAFLNVNLGRFAVDAATIGTTADQPPTATLQAKSSS